MIFLLVGAASVPGTRAVYTMIPRWGHATTFIPSPPTLLIQGGKTDPTGDYTYTSAPNSADVIVLPLSDTFSTSSAPFNLVSSSTAPTYAWHCLSPLQQTSGQWSLLSFGGDGGPTEAVQTLSDSAWQLSIPSDFSSLSATHESAGWGGQPQRRIYHSCAATQQGGKVYITGGMRDDGSGMTFADTFVFDPSSSTFNSFPGLPQGLFHHVSALMPNGTLVVLGGTYTSTQTSNPTLLPLTTIYVLDTTAPSPVWDSRSLSGTVPSGRRGASGALVDNGEKLYIFGGVDAALNEVLSDAWTLDLTSLQWTQISSSGAGPSGRYDHSTVAVGGDQVAIFGGYGSEGPADTALYIFNTASGVWQSNFALSTSSNTPGSNGDSASAKQPTPTANVSTSPNSAGSNKTPVDTKTSDQITKGGSVIDTQGTATSSTTPSDGNHSGHSSLNTSDKIAIAIGIIAALLAAIALFFIFCRRHRKRIARQNDFVRTFLSSQPSSGSVRPYGTREKGGPGLLDDEKLSPSSPDRSDLAGLGMGVVNARMRQLSSIFGYPHTQRDAYAEVSDNVPETSMLSRMPTKKVGEGIRLIGPREPRTSSQLFPSRLSGPSKQRASMPAIKEPRIDMLHDEDRPASWQVPTSPSKWKSASSLLSTETDEEDDGDPFEDISPPKLIPGGPVPTPRGSVLYFQNPFNDNIITENEPRSRPMSPEWRLPEVDSEPLNLNLLTAPIGSYSDGSLPSNRSRYSALMSDAEEGTIHHAAFICRGNARIVSPSPPEIPYQPVKRTESFFRRMAAGGITSLLPSKPIKRNTLEIRDPAPEPSLWPVLSHDIPVPDSAQIEQNHNRIYPPSSFSLALPHDETDMNHGKGPSLSSVHSARSMRDMVVVRREASSSEGTEAVIEMTSPAMTEETSRQITFTPPFSSHDVHSPIELPSSPIQSDVKQEDSKRIEIISPMKSMMRSKTPPGAPESPGSTSSPNKRYSVSGTSPVVLPGTRRPVREVVNSINKRAGSTPTPAALFSPVSTYSAPSSPSKPTGTGVSAPRTTRTTYEAVKRVPLTVANPDKRVGN